MKRKTTIILVGFLFGITILGGIAPARGLEKTTTSLATQDAYVWAEYPDTCFGHAISLFLGNTTDNYDGNWTEIYVVFNLTARPAEWYSAELQFARSGTCITNITGYIRETATSWTEDAITWNNRPVLKTYQENITLKCDVIPRINLTTFLRANYDNADPTTKISLLVNSTPMNGVNYSAFNSIDSAFHDTPYLKWKYTVADPGNDDYTLVIIIVIVGSSIAVGTYLVRNELKKKKPAKPAAEKPAEKPDEFQDLKFGD